MSRSGTAKRGRRSSVIKIYAPAIALTLIGFVVAYQFVEPAPPRTLRIATGAETGAYHRVAMEYRDILARSGITLELVPTSGTVENLRLLIARASDGPQVAFAQSGVSLEIAAGEKTAVKAGTLGSRDEEEQKERAKEQGLISLASVFYEPLWLFHREGLELHSPPDLRGKRIAIGPEGSGTRMLALQVLADNGIPVDTALDLGGEDILDAQVSYSFVEGSALNGMTILFQASNLTDDVYRTYATTKDLPLENIEWGRTYLLGVSYKF